MKKIDPLESFGKAPKIPEVKVVGFDMPFMKMVSFMRSKTEHHGFTRG